MCPSPSDSPVSIPIAKQEYRLFNASDLDMIKLSLNSGYAAPVVVPHIPSA